ALDATGSARWWWFTSDPSDKVDADSCNTNYGGAHVPTVDELVALAKSGANENLGLLLPKIGFARPYALVQAAPTPDNVPKAVSMVTGDVIPNPNPDLLTQENMDVSVAPWRTWIQTQLATTFSCSDDRPNVVHIESEPLRPGGAITLA